MVAPVVEGIDLFKIVGRSISGWIRSLKTGMASHVRQPFCSQLEERLLLWLEYHPQVACYARGDIGPQYAATYRLLTRDPAPFAISYTFEGKPHDYLLDVVGTLTNGKLFTALEWSHQAGETDVRAETFRQQPNYSSYALMRFG